MVDPIETVLAFVAKINDHDPDGLVALTTDDHVFVDSLGNQLRGRDKMRAGWQSYFKMCPDYRVSHEEIFRNGATVAVFGFAGGTISVQGKLSDENRWQIPAAWMVSVRDGRVSEWRVYADNKPVYDILNRMKH
ncbi:MAG: nuclear transport factor 2 family protein [Terriglobales bacterium]|jgi:ketosteroid isomerase-like protein